MTRSATRTRRGFTLVELMVAAAVCVVIMAIMAKCFQIGIDTMRHMRSAGDMADQLRAASVVIQRDLAAEHFIPEVNKPHDGVRVSDQLMDQIGTPAGWTPPLGGFFRVKSPAVIDEGSDAYISSTRSDTTLDAAGRLKKGHLIHFTGVYKGATDHDLFFATAKDLTAQPQAYRALAAEVAYFLDPTPRGWTSANQTVPLFQLVRRQRLAARSEGEFGRLSTVDPNDGLGVISLRKPAFAGQTPPGYAVNRVEDLVGPANRLGGADPAGRPGDAVEAGGNTDGALAPLSAASGRLGDDVLLSNVISFEVKLTWTPGSGEPAPRPFTANPQNTDQPFDTIEQAYRAVGRNDITDFDTGASAANQLKIRVRAIQIRLRVWDPKMLNTRQITIVQDL